MTIKTTVSLPDHVLHYAERLVEEGRYPSLDSVLVASVEDMMRSHENVADDPLAGMADELHRRMALPRDQWIAWDGDAMIERMTKKSAGDRGR
ncbi:hypothetical protein [Rhizobium sp. PP-CC-3G-465]|uniref:hypothetical protein n=1 Tax=Rhizobium sp. PP-CC-3G-465 TaxID=2135648 RepID=UPI00104E2ABC|nr:antitoxin ParD1/3/4 [Rhizobium sp. PP-CC-3G-465]